MFELQSNAEQIIMSGVRDSYYFLVKNTSYHFCSLNNLRNGWRKL